jgi:methylenetetrahydrofolate dehydrogenase (NADP+)/methenyltetrahydrofolate cyclohydrolase
VRPCLAVYIVGEDPASRIYVRRKQLACAAAGIESVHSDVLETATTDEFVAQVWRWNADPAIHGILVQPPLPKRVGWFAVMNAIDPPKDVDYPGGLRHSYRYSSLRRLNLRPDGSVC